jgi:environmental stress-induced protein Ves
MVIIFLSFQLCRKAQQHTSRWSGGTTTEVAIYPQHADYSKRNFGWRISTATVEVEHSTFTPLPGIWRLTMVTDGEMTLQHEGHHQTVLKPYEQDSYSGEWTTQSFGKVEDFNLMMTDGYKGELQALHIDESAQTVILGPYLSTDDINQVFEAIYCVEGAITFSIDGGIAEQLQSGDMLLLSNIDPKRQFQAHFTSEAEKQSVIIRATIFASSIASAI